MKIRVISFKLFPMYVGASLKGTTDIAINEQLILRGIKLFKTGLGFHLQLPENGKGKFGSAYNFLTAGLIKKIEESVVYEYEKCFMQQSSPSTMGYA